MGLSRKNLEISMGYNENMRYAKNREKKEWTFIIKQNTDIVFFELLIFIFLHVLFKNLNRNLYENMMLCNTFSTVTNNVKITRFYLKKKTSFS